MVRIVNYEIRWYSCSQTTIAWIHQKGQTIHDVTLIPDQPGHRLGFVDIIAAIDRHGPTGSDDDAVLAVDKPTGNAENTRCFFGKHSSPYPESTRDRKSDGIGTIF